MEKNPKKITIRDKEQNIKSIQEYKYNEYGDPVIFKKMDSLGKIIIHWIYEYKYDKLKRKTMMKISDVGAGKETTMDYEY
ncbi:MAG: hypothetical protein WBG30_09735 [Psychrilyobacter sp.]|uniref:hypothetical protein n=1 Tax=Psychrilyobacter sp. TaxID=2586924 RepID=UPI003C70AEDB